MGANMRMLPPKVLSACWMCSVSVVWVCGRVLRLPRVTFVVNHLFVVVCGCGPYDKP